MNDFDYAQKVIDYFRPPEKYFWRWADDGQVIEWLDGDTICYRDDLMAILKQLSREGLPSLGTIILIISACREKPVFRLMNYYGKNSSILKGMSDRVIEATQFLHHVAALPPELRSGTNRTWLLYLIFKKIKSKIAAEDTSRYIDIFNSGRLDPDIFGKGLPADTPAIVLGFRVRGADHNVKIFNDDIRWLIQALEAFPTAQELKMAVQTGLNVLPKAAELEVPHLETGNLLEQLEEDPNTTGLVQLTKRLIAALNIPMHAHGSSDQLFGGVSDISNRGNFDRLLLSELAHDDLSLMARLANNEALYLRREGLPSNPEKQRIILVDTTLKMWGLPRVFAVSAALACALNNKTKASIASYALSGTGFNEIDLTTKAGVVRSLEQLDAALHCGCGLSQFMNQQVMRNEDEVFLITEDEITHSVLFQSILASLKKPVNFLVTVNRTGELRFYEYIKGRKKQLSEARFDLQELLFHINTPKKEKNDRTNRNLLNAPAFLQYVTSPLYLPASKIKFNTDCFFEVKKDHLICVTMDQRVLYWTTKMRGAREIIENLEYGQICFGSAGDATLYILVYPGGQTYVRLYEVNLETNAVQITKITETISGLAEIVFGDGYFYIKADNELLAIEAASGKAFPGKDRIGVFDLMLQRKEKAFANMSLNYYKKFVNNGYTTINTVKSVYVSVDGELGLDDRLINLKKISQTIFIRKEQNRMNQDLKATEMEVPVIGLPNTNLKFSRFVWADGSEALADSRGFLHLKSGDSSIPEITITMIIGKPVAFWIANGQVGGPAYFIGEATRQIQDVTWFYKNYIQRFIDRIIAHANIPKV